MLRRNPDAVAMVVFGLLLLAVNAPRFLIRQAHWEVTPLRMEMQADREQIRAVHQQIQAQRDEIKAAAQEIRNSIRR